MILHPEELALARTYATERPFEPLSPEQLKRIKDRGRKLFRWYREHPRLHILVNLAALSSIFLAEYLVLLRLPDLLIPSTGLVVAAVICGALHAWLMYSPAVFSIHEGAAHQTIFPPRGRVTKVMNFVANNLCRLGGSDPEYYSLHHMAHHSKFGTEDDGEFLNFVRPRRFWLSLLPYAFIVNYTDFVVHRPPHYTRSHTISAVFLASYHLRWALLMARAHGWLLPAATFGFVSPHLGFWLERLRQYSEHNLMPLDNNDGSRSFGLGFWGMLVGGGPWGQPSRDHLFSWGTPMAAGLPCSWRRDTRISSPG